jgi:hypothetical protein
VILPHYSWCKWIRHIEARTVNKAGEISAGSSWTGYVQKSELCGEIETPDYPLLPRVDMRFEAEATERCVFASNPRNPAPKAMAARNGVGVSLFVPFENHAQPRQRSPVHRTEADSPACAGDHDRNCVFQAVLICFTEANIKSMFTVLDPFDKGQISRAQMEGALANFGVDPILFGHILGDIKGPFGIDDFTKMILDGLRQTLFPL